MILTFVAAQPDHIKVAALGEKNKDAARHAVEAEHPDQVWTNRQLIRNTLKRAGTVSTLIPTTAARHLNS